MNEVNLKGRPEELIQAEQLILEGKFEEVYKLMDKFLERGESTLKDTLLSNLLKIDIMIQQGLYEDAIKLANQTYKESIELRENVLAFDTLKLEAISLLHLNNLDEALEKIKEGVELLKNIPQELPREYKKRRATLEFLKAWFYYLKNEVDEMKTNLDSCMAFLEETGDSRQLAVVLIVSTIFYGIIKGDLDLNNIKKGYAISKKINFKYGMALGLFGKGIISSLKGDINQGITYFEESLTIFKELNNKNYITYTLNNLAGAYKNIGDLEQALECIESSIKLGKEIGNLMAVANNYDYLIQILIEKDDLERAWNALEQLELICNQLDDKKVKVQYLVDKAFLLKNSSRSRDRIEAEDILKQIIADETIHYEMVIDALLNLCELLLIELRISNDLSILDEINSYTAQLLENAERSHSFLLFAEIYFLKGKLSLLTLDLKNARRFLTQAQRIAERFGFNQLATKISIEHEKLRNQLSIWGDLREEEISLSERMKLAGIDEHMKYLIQRRASLTTQVKEEKITVHRERKICIICKGKISGFMYICDCDALYCEKCARVLIDIENVCWVCNTPIDLAEPIKPYKKDEIEEKDLKNDEFIPKI